MNTLKIDFESLKKDDWSSQELENASLVVDFVQHIMNNHDFDYIKERFGNTTYLQHNRNIPDGINGVIGYVQQFLKTYPDFTYDVKHIFVDGDYVILHSHATLREAHRGNDKKGLNIVDIWRIEDGELVEHWDAVQSLDGFMRFYALMTGGAIRNPNGVF
ncbi:MAG: polyketide cyclase [Chloroflexi bacterium]|nr:MAG: polyketide cyclase [Chloroflexota bacterium]MBL1195220.1 polyketide cyclase [Chloroflexota bacterium]NOH12505.1 SnoaL-like domain-containing protein [Chloroflexota bacterium]